METTTHNHHPKEYSTCLLGDGLSLALDKSRKIEFTYTCDLCNRKHCGVFFCEFCLATELYTRRKTFAFMKLDLCVQAAVCLIAKSSTLGGGAAGASHPLVTSENFQEQVMLDPYTGDSKDEN